MNYQSFKTNKMLLLAYLADVPLSSMAYLAQVPMSLHFYHLIPQLRGTEAHLPEHFRSLTTTFDLAYLSSITNPKHKIGSLSCHYDCPSHSRRTPLIRGRIVVRQQLQGQGCLQQ